MGDERRAMVMRQTDRDLDRLVELELVEIPRLLKALRAWPDDAHLSAELRRYQDEALELSERLGIPPDTPRSAPTTTAA
jgi:hypothetical protein